VHVVRAWLDEAQHTIEHHGTHHTIMKLTGICHMEGTQLICLLVLGHYTQSSIESTFLLAFYVYPPLRKGDLSRRMLAQSVNYLRYHNLHCCSPLKACTGKFAASSRLRGLFKGAGFHVSSPPSQKDIVFVEFGSEGRSKRVTTQQSTMVSLSASAASKPQPATPLPSSLKEQELCSPHIGSYFQTTVSSKRPSSSMDPMEPSAKSAAVVMDRSTQWRIAEMEKKITALTTQNQALTAEKHTMEAKLQMLGEKHLADGMRNMPSPAAGRSTARAKR